MRHLQKRLRSNTLEGRIGTLLSRGLTKSCPNASHPLLLLLRVRRQSPRKIWHTNSVGHSVRDQIWRHRPDRILSGWSGTQ